MSDERLSNVGLMRVMVLKEIRTTFRERSQVAAVLVALVMLVVVLTGSLLPAIYGGRAGATTRPTTVPAAVAALRPRPPTPTPTPMKVLRWAGIGIVAFVGFFFSCGYLFAAVLATFVGEKEGRTLEVLLASPIPDAKLYLVKCVSVLLPSAGLGIVFAFGAAVLAGVLAPPGARGVSAGLLAWALVLGVPVILLPQIWFVGLGAAISARTETMKGAGQVLGVTLLLLIFGTTYGLPAAVALVPPAHRAAVKWAGEVQTWPFAGQYLTTIVVLMVPAVLFLGLGKVAFRRDRMLT